MSTPDHETPVSREEKYLETGWRRYARWIGFGVLAAVTGYGAYQFATGDWASVTDYWQDKLYILPIVFGLALADLCFEGAAYIWVAERFRLHARDFTGFLGFLTAKAGMLMPAQLGRLIRPDAMVRMGRGSLVQNLKVEGSFFVFDVISVVALLLGLSAFLVHPGLGLLAGGAIITASLFLGGQLARYLAGTKLELPKGFWWSWQSFGIVAVQLTGWAIHGLAFYAVVADLPGTVRLWDALFLAPASAVFGVGSGMPGGVGVTEGLLGVSLKFNGVPAAHLALTIAAFRLITFWLMIVVGWLALGAVGRRAKHRMAQVEAENLSVLAEPRLPVAAESLSASADGS